MSQPVDSAVMAPSEAPVYQRINYLNVDRGVASWLKTLDHKRIGIMYLVSVLVAFLLGGIFAMIVRLELTTPEPTFIGANTYNRMFTLHGMVMIFLFMIPAIPGVFGNFCLPLMLGAKDVAFPRLNLLSLYVYWTGAVLVLWGVVTGGADTGWTFYAPYSTTTPMTLFPVLLGVFVIGFSSILTGPELHRHDPHAARAGDRLDEDAAFCVGDIRHQHHPGVGDAGHRFDDAAGRH